MGRRPRCRWKKCNKWFGEQAWFYIYDHRYFCSPECVVDYCLINTPDKNVLELQFTIKRMPIPKRPKKGLDFRTEKIGSEIRVGFVPENLPVKDKEYRIVEIRKALPPPRDLGLPPFKQEAEK